MSGKVKGKNQNNKVISNNVSNINEKDLSYEELKLCLKKNEYETKLMNDIKSCDIDTNLFKKFLYMFIFTVLWTGFNTWCSAGDTSNYMLILKNEHFKYVIVWVPYVFCFVYLYFLYKTVKNRRIKMELEWLSNELEQKRILTRFILSKLNLPTDNFYQYTKTINNLGDQYPDGIVFFADEFHDYVNSIAIKYLKYVGINFSRNLSELIVLIHILDKTLIEENNYQYSYIVKNNSVFIVQAGLLAK